MRGFSIVEGLAAVREASHGQDQSLDGLAGSRGDKWPGHSGGLWQEAPRKGLDFLLIGGWGQGWGVRGKRALEARELGPSG